MWTTLALIDATAALTACVLSLALSRRRLLRTRREHAPELGPYDAAFLAGGPDRVVEAALHTLWGGGGSVVAGSGGRLRLLEPGTEPAHPVEHALVEQWRASGRASSTMLRPRAVRTRAVREVGDRLVSYGLVLSPARARARMLAARSLVAVAFGTAALAAFALTQGLRHAVPFLAVGVCCLTVRVLCPARDLLTPMGRRRLSALRRSEPWAAAPLGAVVFDGRSGLPGERRRPQRRNEGGSRLPSVGRMLVKFGKALDSDSDDRGTHYSSGGHGAQGSDSSHDTHGSSYDGGGHHHICGGGSSCGGGNY
ncbi:TIGR04222 domain-containing membrane protein [Streptomyces sp. NBC_01618]|uniref:TIGR04222 domain-containing membrane protein n=1 Tax=Streptomyces sp. NBC_01618 TaxID=2975900 RepID=UPI00386DFFD6|nr:TIGR04222 domain-containing membrane protein [Streptomyces sp. NBC_01618]